MGDRAMVLVQKDADDNGVYLYTHSWGRMLPVLLQNALRRRVRWDDTAYLTRIIFDAMTDGEQGGELGFGISTFPTECSDRILVVNVARQTVSRGEQTVTFKSYCAATSADLHAIW